VLLQATGVLSAITSLKKLCNHPKLIYDTLHSKAQVGVGRAAHATEHSCQFGVCACCLQPAHSDLQHAAQQGSRGLGHLLMPLKRALQQRINSAYHTELRPAKASTVAAACLQFSPVAVKPWLMDCSVCLPAAQVETPMLRALRAPCCNY
jgi:hypothetical protein